MAVNLRDRLKRIHEQKKNAEPSQKVVSKPSVSVSLPGWQPCGFQVSKREVKVDTPLKLHKKLPLALPIVIPDFNLCASFVPSCEITAENFLFFDLETTGLSGGAGTVAFLAAFGRLTSGGKLHITQYLLLDYPGENDFIQAALSEFKKQSVIVSYNGKCFDSQILKTRCLMNGIKPPEYAHADLLHPARRLWKNVIHDCSQASVETRILGLDRSGDIPGALAPEIWFEFLKTGRTDRLTGICDHNISDISGLAVMLSAMISIAADPFAAMEIRYDIERLALHWRKYSRRNADNDLMQTGNKLLEFITQSDFPENSKAAALRILAIDSERRLKDYNAAYEFTKRGLELKKADQYFQDDFNRRIERLEKKMRS